MEIVASPEGPRTAPRVTSCSGCGACCSMQGAPPDYVALRLHPLFAQDPTFTEDADRLARLPADAQDRLERYLVRSASGEIPTDGPCVWYDDALEHCAYYDWRPSTCRVFELDGPGCHIYRRLRGIETPL